MRPFFCQRPSIRSLERPYGWTQFYRSGNHKNRTFRFHLILHNYSIDKTAFVQVIGFPLKFFVEIFRRTNSEQLKELPQNFIRETPKKTTTNNNRNERRRTLSFNAFEFKEKTQTKINVAKNVQPLGNYFGVKIDEPRWSTVNRKKQRDLFCFWRCFVFLSSDFLLS